MQILNAGGIERRGSDKAAGAGEAGEQPNQSPDVLPIQRTLHFRLTITLRMTENTPCLFTSSCPAVEPQITDGAFL
jgi:hypothetical protein